MAQNIWNWCKQSLTILWARVLTGLGVLLSIALPILDALGQVDLSQALPGKWALWAPVIVAGIGVITELCRRRTLSN